MTAPRGSVRKNYNWHWYQIPRFPSACGNCIIPGRDWTKLDDFIDGHTNEGVCRIETDACVVIGSNISRPDVSLDIKCKSFVNVAQLQFASIHISAQDGNLVNAGIISSKAGDVNLSSSRTLISSTSIISSEDMSLRCNGNLLTFGNVVSGRDSNFYAGNDYYNIGGTVSAGRDSHIKCENLFYNGPSLTFPYNENQDDILH